MQQGLSLQHRDATKLCHQDTRQSHDGRNRSAKAEAQNLAILARSAPLGLMFGKLRYCNNTVRLLRVLVIERKRTHPL